MGLAPERKDTYMAEKKIEELTYKEASQELEQSLESYTRGVALVKSLRERLDSAEQQVKILVKDMDGTDTLVAGEAASTDDQLSI